MDLNIPLSVEITQNGKVVYEKTIRANDINDGSAVKEYELIGAESVVDMDAEYTVVYKAAIFDRVVELASKDFNVEDDTTGGTTGGGNGAKGKGNGVAASAYGGGGGGHGGMFDYASHTFNYSGGSGAKGVVIIRNHR